MFVKIKWRKPHMMQKLHMSILKDFCYFHRHIIFINDFIMFSYVWQYLYYILLCLTLFYYYYYVLMFGSGFINFIMFDSGFTMFDKDLLFSSQCFIITFEIIIYNVLICLTMVDIILLFLAMVLLFLVVRIFCHSWTQSSF